MRCVLGCGVGRRHYATTLTRNSPVLKAGLLVMIMVPFVGLDSMEMRAGVLSRVTFDAKQRDQS